MYNSYLIIHYYITKMYLSIDSRESTVRDLYNWYILVAYINHGSYKINIGILTL